MTRGKNAESPAAVRREAIFAGEIPSFLLIHFADLGIRHHAAPELIALTAFRKDSRMGKQRRGATGNRLSKSGTARKDNGRQWCSAQGKRGIGAARPLGNHPPPSSCKKAVFCNRTCIKFRFLTRKTKFCAGNLPNNWNLSCKTMQRGDPSCKIAQITRVRACHRPRKDRPPVQLWGSGWPARRAAATGKSLNI